MTLTDRHFQRIAMFIQISRTLFAPVSSQKCLRRFFSCPMQTSVTSSYDSFRGMYIDFGSVGPIPKKETTPLKKFSNACIGYSPTVVASHYLLLITINKLYNDVINIFYSMMTYSHVWNDSNFQIYIPSLKLYLNNIFSFNPLSIQVNKYRTVVRKAIR